MGREVKRVALNFKWPLKKTWEGYLNPHYRKCSVCHEGRGITSACARLETLVSLILLSGADTVRTYGTVPHPYFHNMGYHSTAGQVVSPDMKELTDKLAGRMPGILGYESCDSWKAMKKIIAAAGLDPDKWGICTICNGSGRDPQFEEAYEAWQPTEPPTGEGWQMWETTSGGSPISPVCTSPQELAHWLADFNATSSGKETESYETWLAFILGPGWAPSAVMQDGDFVSGVKAVIG